MDTRLFFAAVDVEMRCGESGDLQGEAQKHELKMNMPKKGSISK